MEESSVRVEIGSAPPSAPEPPSPGAGSGRPIVGLVAVAAVIVGVVAALVTLAPDDGKDAAGDLSEPITTSTTLAATSMTAPVAGRNPVDRLGSFDPESIIRTDDDAFFAVGTYPEVRLWTSDDGVSWTEVDAQFDVAPIAGSAESHSVATLGHHNGALSLVVVANGRTVQRFESTDGVRWAAIEQVDLPAGVDRFPIGQTSTSVGMLDGPGDSRMTILVRSAVAAPAIFESLELCGLERATATTLGFVPCGDSIEPLLLSAADLRPGVAFERVSECAQSLERSMAPFASITVMNNEAFATAPFDGGIPVVAAALEAQDRFAFLIDDFPGLRRRSGELGDSASSCEEFGVIPEVPIAVGSTLIVVDAAGGVERIDLPDRIGFNSSVSVNNGPQISEDPDGDGLLILLGDHVWHVAIDSGGWTQVLEREVTFTSSGQTVLSSTGGTLVLLGSTMRAGSIPTGEWVDINVDVPPQGQIVYVDDELVIIVGNGGRFARVDLPRFE